MDAKLILTGHDLRKLPMSWFQHSGKGWEIEQALKKAVESQWDNSRLMFEYYGLFTIQFHKQRNTNTWSWAMWDACGHSSIGKGSFTVSLDQPMPKNTIKTIVQLCDDYNHNIIRCSGCGNHINRDDIAGRYFAGVYCQHCWDTKYKAIETAETYE